MKNYGGDLADIIRTGGTINGSIPDITDQYIHEFDEDDQNPVGLEEEDPLLDEFGDPFSLLLQDPLITTTTAVDGYVGEVTDFFSNNNSAAAVDMSVEGVASAEGCSGFFRSSALEGCRFGGDDNDHHQRASMIDDHDHQEELIRRPRFNFFQRMLQISPAANTTKLSNTTTTTQVVRNHSPAVGGGGGSVKSNPATLAVNDVMLSNSKGENAGLQISPPRNAGIKRRKSQAKKVVCIPAPAPVNSRPSGEIVPSDLWAWRKYGQKPIKGSPYPRGYYRCSSSKGCPARKQVERNRSDPNMLVITYTCDHNHPWPTQRNALAGSTRNTTHPPVSKPGSKYSKIPSSSSSQSHKSPTALFKQEQMEEIATPSQNYNSPSFVKEEVMEDVIEKQNDEFRQSYKPVIFQELSSQSDDFFAELGELESDPMNLLFPNGYSQVDDGENKSLDPFTFYDWAGKSSASSITEEHNMNK